MLLTEARRRGRIKGRQSCVPEPDVTLEGQGGSVQLARCRESPLVAGTAHTGAS